MDPLMAMMPSWSTYNFNFNNPIYFTDKLGLVGNGGDNTNSTQLTPKGILQEKSTGSKKLIIVYDCFALIKKNTPTIHKWDYADFSDDDMGEWDYLVVDDFSFVENWIKNYASQYGDLTDVVIISHGSLSAQGSLRISGAHTDISSQDLEEYMSTGGINVFPNGEPRTDQINALNSLQAISDNLDDNAKVVFYACSQGRYTEMNDALTKFFNNKAKNITVYTNADYSVAFTYQDDKAHVKFNANISTVSTENLDGKYEKGWIRNSYNSTVKQVISIKTQRNMRLYNNSIKLIKVPNLQKTPKSKVQDINYQNTGSNGEVK